MLGGTLVIYHYNIHSNTQDTENHLMYKKLINDDTSYNSNTSQYSTVYTHCCPHEYSFESQPQDRIHPRSSYPLKEELLAGTWQGSLGTGKTCHKNDIIH